MDTDPNRLAVLRRYDMDTGAELFPQESFDYLIDGSMDEKGPTQISEHWNNAVRKVRLRSANNQAAVPDAGVGERGIYISKDRLELDWKEAVRLVDDGTINLADHTSVIYPLEAYQDVWAVEGNHQHYKVLLRPNQVLEGL